MGNDMYSFMFREMDKEYKSKRREEKRRKRERGKLLRGNQWIRLRAMLSKKRYHKAMTLEDKG